jgi:hypothetical protein
MSDMPDYLLNPISCDRAEMTLNLGDGMWMMVSMLDRQIAREDFLGAGARTEIRIEGLDAARTGAVRMGERYCLVAWVGAYVVMRKGVPKYVIYTESSP